MPSIHQFSPAPIQPVNQQLSLYAIDGDTLDRLFAQYISTVLSSRQQQLLHSPVAADGSSTSYGGLVDIRKDQQLQQMMGSGSSPLSAVNEKAVILLKGSHSQLVINGNFVQYIYNVDSAKCNLAHHHSASNENVSWHRNQSSTPPSTLSVKQALKTTLRLRPPPSTKKAGQSTTTTRFVPTRFLYPAAPTSAATSLLASSTRAVRLPFDELYELKRRFIENKRNFFSRILSTTTTRRPLFPSFAKWIIQGNFRQGRRR
ncbi:hypothetical protein TYRP_016620 [Tyrophagus putrescentiae]|nr:hypothetical protein TYRP_016620 [Tyrophagus putrescentiae]